MSAAVVIEEHLSSAEVVERAAALKEREDWAAIAELAAELPKPLGREWLRAADEVAFALGRLGQTDRAAALVEAAFALEPTARRASALAYLFYDALLRDRGRGAPSRDREAFRAWMSRALSYDEPIRIKSLYRLGVYEAQVEHQRDRAALRAFLKAIETYLALDEATRARRHDLRRFYVKALYAGARSALRLRDLGRARHLAFECLREDRESDHVAPLHKLYLAGRACTELGLEALAHAPLPGERGAEGGVRAGVDARWLEHAERAFRKALDAPGPRGGGRRDFVYVKLAELCLAAGRPADGERWLEANVPPHRRRGATWRLLGELLVAQHRSASAMIAFRNALDRDRFGRHLTLTHIGRLHLAKGEPKDAEKAFRDALKFRQRRWLSV